MPFVLDASITLAWCFEDETTPYADRVLDLLNDDVAIAPAIWTLEVANAVLVGERRQRLEVADTARFAELLGSLPITVDEMKIDRAMGPVVDLARTYNLTTYDAAYIDLAMREGVPLATQDRRMADAATQCGVELIE